MNELVKGLVLVVYSLLFWSAMAAGLLMVIVVGLALWNTWQRRQNRRP